ncbi:MAG: type II toxin-antitoxin system RelE/ParE family toxin [Gammaproteobacteria bacterium]|nr:type II toxin-antitoxin system RelE/ParE family toxin [Gammaproteobacteria bacterium]
MERELHYYKTVAGRKPFVEWVECLKDARTRAKVDMRLYRIELGNFGDTRSVGEGVMELRIDWGPGYRVYYACMGRVVVLLLCGGNKNTQFEDIERAKRYFKDYKARAKKEGTAGAADRVLHRVVDRKAEGP